MADRRATTFLLTYGLLPVGIQLRRSWLENLAQRAQWDTFLSVFREAGASDALRCQALAARISTGQTAELGPLLVRQWLAPHQAPECDTVYAWGLDHGLITADLLERRARTALQAGNSAVARTLIARLPEGQAAPLRQWAALLEAPRPNIDALLADPGATVLPGALLGGGPISPPGSGRRRRPVRVAAAGARPELTDGKPVCPGRRAAAGMAPDARAEDFFARVATPALDDTALEWRARAAMWAANWPLATQAIGMMSPTNQQSARWRYWLARAQEQTGDPAQAHPCSRRWRPTTTIIRDWRRPPRHAAWYRIPRSRWSGILPCVGAWNRTRPWCGPTNCCCARCGAGARRMAVRLR